MDPQPDGFSAILQAMTPLFLIFIIFYFLLIRPQQKQREQHEKRVSQLKKGDRVITAGGIYATIIGIKDDIAAIKINEETKVEVQKSAITHVLDKDDKKSE